LLVYRHIRCKHCANIFVEDINTQSPLPAVSSRN
jgi:hypothetical protein